MKTDSKTIRKSEYHGTIREVGVKSQFKIFPQRNAVGHPDNFLVDYHRNPKKSDKIEKEQSQVI